MNMLHLQKQTCTHTVASTAFSSACQVYSLGLGVTVAVKCLIHAISSFDHPFVTVRYYVAVLDCVTGIVFLGTRRFAAQLFCFSCSSLQLLNLFALAE